MKAIVCEKYGSPDVLKLQEIEKPVPGDNDVLIKVHATTVSAADYRVRGLNTPPGFRLLMRLALGFKRPRAGVLGTEFAGTVEATGKNARRFKAGDHVFGATGVDFGANAEYVRMPDNGRVTRKPENLTFEEAAAIPFGASTALQFLRDKGRIRAGQKVLIYGASGSVGTAAVQLARYFGAEVTGVCGTANMEMVRSLGAHKVIDYTKQDFAKSGEKYDLILETVGKASVSDCKNALRPRGVCLLVVAGVPRYLWILWNSLTSRRKVIAGVTSENIEDLEFMAELVRAGKLKPVIDRRYPLAQAAEAHRYADLGHKKGNIVLVPG